MIGFISKANHPQKGDSTMNKLKAREIIMKLTREAMEIYDSKMGCIIPSQDRIDFINLYIFANTTEEVRNLV